MSSTVKACGPSAAPALNGKSKQAATPMKRRAGTINGKRITGGSDPAKWRSIEEAERLAAMPARYGAPPAISFLG
jgi:hypothetical protein